MKRLATIIGMVAASFLFTSAQVYTADKPINEGYKNECLLVSRNCGDSVDSIQQRMDKLNTEISKGTGVYTRDELRILNKKLEDERRNLELIEMGG